MNITKPIVRKISMKIAKNKSMQNITNVIMSKCTLDENGKLWSPSGMCVGWYNPETGVGWCNMAGYKELKAMMLTEQNYQD